MKRVLKWLGITAGGIAMLGIGAAAVLWILSERIVRETYEAPFDPIVVPDDSASVASGFRLARVLGCFDGCHGEGVSGQVFFDEPGVARLVAPNLTRMLERYSNEELARLIRYGVNREGRSSWAMPAPMFYHVSDEDVASVIAFLRTLPPSDGPDVEVTVRPVGRMGVVMREFVPAAAEVDRTAPRSSRSDPADPHALGRYVAMTSCTECHGQDLRGVDGQFGAPSLEIVAAYRFDDFERFMRTGEALGGRELELMSSVARSRFAYLTDDEVAALHAFLQSALASGAGSDAGGQGAEP